MARGPGTTGAGWSAKPGHIARSIMGAAGPVILAKLSITDPEVLVAIGLLAGTVLAGAIVLALVDRWRKRQANETLSTHDELATYRLLYEQGDLSPDEYE